MVALSAAVLLQQASTALADGPTDDPCFRQDIECYGQQPGGEQLPEEVIGSYRCPEATDVVLALNPDGSYVCGPLPGSQPPPVDTNPAPAPPVAASTPQGPAPTQSQTPENQPQAASTPGHAPQTDEVAVPTWTVTMEQILEWMRDLLPWLFVPAQQA